MQSSPSLREYFTLKEHLIQNLSRILIGLLCLFLVDFLQLLIPTIIKGIINRLNSGIFDPNFLYTQGLIIILLAIFIAIFRFFWRYLLLGNARLIEESLREELFRHIQSLPFPFFQRRAVGDLMARFVNDLNAIRMSLGMGIVALFDGIVLGGMAIVFMIKIDPVLTLISLIPMPVVIYLTKMLTDKMTSGYEKIQSQFSSLTERVREGFSGIRIITAYNKREWMSKRIRNEAEEYARLNIWLSKVLGIFFPLMGSLSNLGLVFLILIGGRFAITERISIGDFVAFMGYLSLLSWPMMAIGWVINLIRRGATSMHRINEIMEESPEESSIYLPFPIKGEIEVVDLDFSFSDSYRRVLKEINLKIDAGSTVAIVGRVGSGKSTLLYHLVRLYEPSRGRVFIDGVDILDIPIKELRAQIGFSTQESIVFSDTIKENVIAGRRGIDDRMVEVALRISGLYDEVAEMKDGIYTLLGERGLELSGGQRQRLCLARAIVPNPPLLILDNALSMVDMELEMRIMDMVLSHRLGLTNIIVSHRINTIREADLIFVLKDGRLEEIGNHASLMERKGEYYRIYEKEIMSQELEKIGRCL